MLVDQILRNVQRNGGLWKEEGRRLWAVASGRAETVRPVGPLHVVSVSPQPSETTVQASKVLRGGRVSGAGLVSEGGGLGRRLCAVGEGGRCWWRVFCFCFFICTV